MQDGSTEKPEYPHTSELLYAFCVDGLVDPNDMIRRLNHAERDTNLPKSVAAEVRDALWELAAGTFHGGVVGRPPSLFAGVARPARRRSR